MREQSDLTSNDRSPSFRYLGIKLVWTEEDQPEGTEVKPEHAAVEQFKESAP